MWFDIHAISHGTEPASFARGLQLFRSQAVRDCHIEPDPTAPPGLGWTLSGHVQGTLRQPYGLRVYLVLQPDGRTPAQWTGLCSCPVGVQCKHAVALLIKAAYSERDPVAAAGAVVRSAPSRAQAAAEREQALQAARQQEAARHLALQAQRWLTDDAERPGAPGASAKTRPLVPLYLLQVHTAQRAEKVLHLHLGASTRTVKGGWSKPRKVAADRFLRPYGEAVALTDQDRDVLRLLAALPAVTEPYRYQPITRWALDGPAAALVLQGASDTGRLYLLTEEDYAGVPLRWGPAQTPDWQWQQSAGPLPGPALWQLQARLPQAHATLAVNDPPLYLDLEQAVVGPLHSTGPTPLRTLLTAPPLPEDLMRQHQDVLHRRLGSGIALPPVLPALRQVGGTPLWRLHLSPLADASWIDDAPPQALSAQLDFDYQGVQGWWPTPKNPQLVTQADGGRTLVTRDLASEQQAVARLQALGLVELADGLFALEPSRPLSLWLAWSETGFEPLREAGFEVAFDAALRDWVQAGGEPVLTLQAHGDADADTADWFDLSLGLEVNGQRINLLPWLPDIIAQVRPAGQGPEPIWPPHLYLPQADGQRFLKVSTAPLKPWLDALLELFDERRPGADDEALKLSRIDALRASLALGEGLAWDGAQRLQALVQALQDQRTLPATPLPPGLNAQLRPYQQHGLDWLQFLRSAGLGGILADDMGLGKTLQTLAHILCEKAAGRLDRPALVVAPVSLLGNWRREAQRFCPTLHTLVLHGADRHGQVTDLAQTDLVIAPYSLLHRDRERWLAQPWHLVVLDEAHHIKNTATQAFQVVTELNTRHRLSLSGTPIENHLGELWAQFHFLMPGFLGSQTRFTQRFRSPIEKQGDSQRMAALRARVTPFILRRHKSDVATELPPKVESVMPVEISGKQADLYETIRLSMEQAVRQAMADKGLAKSQITILDALLKLRQVCCDPRLVKTAAAAKVKQSAKLEQLMSVLPEMLAEGRRILLFSAFTSMLSLIEDELKKHAIAWVKLTGQTQKRDEVIDRFTSGQVPLFLISLKAGGVGLNLPQADTVIHYDPWWNPAAENQATDRAHRIGQTQSVWVLKLVAQGTIEERILALQERKAELARELYSGAAARKQALFTEDDVKALLQPLG